MESLTLCHYRGRENGKCPARILGYYTGQRESLGELGLLFLHSEKDAEACGADISNLYSFDCPKVGVMAYRISDNTLAVGINFVHQRTLLLINNGVGERACFSTNHAGAWSLETEKVMNITKRIIADDASKGIKVMNPLNEVIITPNEAKAILKALLKNNFRDEVGSGVLINQEEFEAETPLFNATIAYLEEISKVFA